MGSKVWEKVKHEPLVPVGQWRRRRANKPASERRARTSRGTDDHLSVCWLFVCVCVLGAAATAGAFAFGLRAMLQSNAHRQQMMMRARVGAQAFTILAFLGYSFTNISPQTGMTRLQSGEMERKKRREAALDAAQR